ncbi:MAG: ImpA family type VI secretion system protein, partial [Planctomycetia bacterium]
MLDDPDRGLRFPSTLRLLPLVWHDGAPMSFFDRERALKGEGEFPADAFDRAVDAAAPQAVVDLADSVAEARTALRGLLDAMNLKLGGFAPSLSKVRDTLEAVAQATEWMRRRRGPAAGSTARSTGTTAAGGSDPTAAGASTGFTPSTAPASRDEVYRALRHAADVLEKLEPHSPVPFLVRRAVDLGAMPFPVMIKQLVRDAAVLEGLFREIGVPETGS